MTTTPVPAGAPGRVAVGVSGVRPGRTGWLVIVGVASIVVAFVAGIALGIGGPGAIDDARRSSSTASGSAFR